MLKPTVLASAVFALFACAAQAAQIDTRADALLQQSKEVTGGKAWDAVKTLHETAALNLPELKGSLQVRLDLAHQYSVRNYDLGVIKGADGWDGRESWSVDATGVAQTNTAADDKADAVSSVYRDSLAFWYPERMPATRSYAGERSADGQVYDAIKIEPEGGLAFELWINRANHRIERSLALTGDQPVMEIYADFRTVNGVSLPFALRSVFVKTGKENQETHVESAVFNEEFAANTFAQPAPPAADYHFPDGSHSVTLPFHLDANHIMVNLGLTGDRPLNVIFDTGALNLIDSKLASQLGIKSEGAIQGGGFGSETTSFGLAKVAQMTLAGVSFTNQPFVTMNLEKLNHAAGEPFDGLIGYEVAKRMVVKIDYPAKQLSLIEGSTFLTPANAVRLPLKFAGRTPILEAKVNGVVGEFQLDTGSRGGLWLTHAFTSAHPEFAGQQWSTPFVDGYGVGGATRATQSRIQTLELGTIKLSNLHVATAAEESGNEGSGHSAGNIGGAIFKHFIVTLDYAHNCVYLEPATPGFSDAGDYDRSGMFLMRAAQAGGIEVLDVAAESAAARAGIRAGEHILRVNQQPVSGLELEKLRELFKSAPGTQFVLTLQDSQGKHRDSTLTL